MIQAVAHLFLRCAPIPLRRLETRPYELFVLFVE